MKKQIKFSDIIMVASIMAVFISFIIAVKVMSNVVTEHFENEIIVCLDAGHGASDNGAESTDGARLEKNDNIRLTLLVGEKLKEKGVQVLYTRKTDAEITLKQRCKLANKYRCSLFVSIHRNSSATGTGIEAWVSNSPKGEEKQLATEIVDELCKITNLQNRGVKIGYRDSVNENYYINANTNMPSLLLEVGFITSKTDNTAFDNNIVKIAESVSENIYDFITKDVEKTQ